MLSINLTITVQAPLLGRVAQILEVPTRNITFISSSLEHLVVQYEDMRGIEHVAFIKYEQL